MDRGLGRGTVVCSALVLLIVVFAGCGGGGDSTTEGDISKAAVLKQGNAICAKGNAAIEHAAAKQFPKGGVEPRRSAQVRFIAVTVVPNLEAQIDALQALGTPAGDEGTVDTFLTEAENALLVVKKDPSVMTTGGPGPFAGADKFATSYGLTACGFNAE